MRNHAASRPASSVALSASGSNSLVSTASPIPRSRMSRSRPRRTFLSTDISPSMRSGESVAGARTGRPDPHEQALDSFAVLAGEPPHAMRHPRREHDARRHRLAVQPRAVARAGLDGVGERVPEIEQRPHPGFALVGDHERRLALARPHHRGAQRIVVELEQG